LRVVAGSLGGRRLVGPDGSATRPTTDRVREAMFNALGSAGIVDGAIVADLFAGTGAIGIEALSRGAARCIFVERDRAALRALDQNIAALGLGTSSSVLRTDVMSAAATIDADVVFADPPYGFDRWSELLDRLRAGVVVLESDGPLDPAAVTTRGRWVVTRAKRYGRTWVTFLEAGDPLATGVLD